MDSNVYFTTDTGQWTGEVYIQLSLAWVGGGKAVSLPGTPGLPLCQCPWLGKGSVNPCLACWDLCRGLCLVPNVSCLVSLDSSTHKSPRFEPAQ